MRVFVEIYELSPDSPVRRQALEEVRAVSQVFDRLGLAGRGGLAILVNGRLARWDTALQDGDVVRIIPAIGGG